MDLGLSGRTAVVTGASKGIGRAVALELAAEGANVVAAARSQEALAEVAEAAAGLGGKVATVAVDCSTAEAADAVLGRAREEFGDPDILVNNLGTGSSDHSWDTDVAEFEFIMNINLYSAVRFARACVPSMKAQEWGRIINMSSVSAHSGLPNMGDYNASKAGMVSWSKTLSHELAPHGITVNSLCPAFIETPLWDALADTLTGTVADTREGVYQKMAEENVVMGRYGTPQEVSGLCALLASDRAGFITGVAYNIDGGYTTFAF
jgi:NAD(P)-dependent dehydrogenase (short-subunit alcohol dehydrogenase family)